MRTYSNAGINFLNQLILKQKLLKDNMWTLTKHTRENKQLEGKWFQISKKNSEFNVSRSNVVFLISAKLSDTPKYPRKQSRLLPFYPPQDRVHCCNICLEHYYNFKTSSCSPFKSVSISLALLYLKRQRNYF